MVSKKTFLRIALILILTLIVESSLYGQEFWTPTGNLSPSGGDWVPEIACNSSGTLFAYSHGVGIFKSTNNGDDWSLSGVTGPRVSSLNISPDNKVFAICNNTSGIYIQRSTNDGLTWDQVYSAQHSDNYFSGSGMVFIDSTTIVAVISFTLGPTLGDIGVEIVRSTDDGTNWQLLGISGSWGGAEDLVKLNDGRIVVTTTSSGMSYSSDNGSTWHFLSSFPPYSMTEIAAGTNGDIFVGRSTAGSSEEILSRSTDNGQSWQGAGIISGLNGGDVQAIYIDHNNKIYVSFINFGPMVRMIYCSSDNGDSWQQCTDGMPSAQLAYHFTGNAEGVIFAGTESAGVYKGSESVPVELTSFTADVEGSNVRLNWATSTETNNLGFDIERIPAKTALNEGDTGNPEKIGFVKGSGTTTESVSYSFTDINVPAGKYLYRLKQIDFNGSIGYSPELLIEVVSLSVFSLEQNYPNPFNPSTTIEYTIPETGNVLFKLYNALGEEVLSRNYGIRSAGNHRVNFDASDLSGGVYIYQIISGRFSESRKMLLLQ